VEQSAEYLITKMILKTHNDLESNRF